jgi:hypothetical protein
LAALFRKTRKPVAKPARKERMAMVIKLFAFDEASGGDGDFKRGVIVGHEDG